MRYRFIARLIIPTVAITLLLSASLSLHASTVPALANLPTSNATIYLPLIARSWSSGGATLGGCPMFPADNVWNARVDALPVNAKSNTYINFIGGTKGLHPDFGGGLWDGGPIGIPYNLVPGAQPLVPITFDYADESDPGPYPIPPSPQIEWGSDHHVLIVDTGHCVLYETWDTRYSGGWLAGSGAKFDLNSNALRPAGWTSADAAGLPILPGLVRYDEVIAGEIKHAIRFTIRATNGNYVWPARHLTTSPFDSNAPPMGQRLRLKASFDISAFSPQVQVILTAFKRYGIIMADNGSDWYIGGAPDARWNDDTLVTEFQRVHGSDFEAVDESGLMVDSNSGSVR